MDEDRSQIDAAPNATGPEAVSLAPSSGVIRAWRIVQLAVLLVGVAIVVALVAWPAIGIHAFWNVLIPVAPALLVFAPGAWRNVCPLGSVGMLPRHLGWSRDRAVDVTWQGRFALLGVVLLLGIVPLRHVVFDTNGPATAFVLVVLACLAFAMGLVFRRKSGWCSGPCPVHPVEKLYGQGPLVSPPNAHCGTCTNCVAPCPESTPLAHPLLGRGSDLRGLAGVLLVGGFPGFIWGWFHVPDYTVDGWEHLLTAYGWPYAAAAVTLVAFVALRRLLGPAADGLLVRVFAAAAIACYYWYRLPALVGFGPFPGDGMLVDLTMSLPSWVPAALKAATTALFLYLLVLRTPARRAWTQRPPLET